MPPKQCAKCTKTVYPTEELKCLDKVWHKGCFKCDACNMTLNMKNYKGYNKIPYCSAHYPTTKFTSVADTPENRRIAANTQIQSNVHYHKDFDASKDKFTTVADTPQFRAMSRNKEYSMIKYHEEFEREKGKVTVVADDPEVLRVKKNMNIISNISYHGEKDKKQEMERIRPAEQVEAGRHRQNPGRIADYDPAERQDMGAGGTPYSNRNSAGARQVYDSSVGKDPQRALAYQARRYYKEDFLPASPTSPPGRVDAGRRISQGSVRNRVSRFSSSGDEEQAFMEQPQARQVGSIHDYDPLNENYGSIAGQQNQDSRRAQQAPQQPYQPPPQQYQPPPQQYQPPPQQYQPPPQQYQPPPQQYQPPPKAEPPKNKFAGKGMVCQAMYDYDAADEDEVSFKEGDVIICCQPIDAGWMEGEVEKSGKRGMLPSNYVEKIN